MSQYSPAIIVRAKIYHKCACGHTHTNVYMHACMYCGCCPRCIAYIETYKTTTCARAYEPAAKLWCSRVRFAKNLCNLTELAGGQTARKRIMCACACVCTYASRCACVFHRSNIGSMCWKLLFCRPCVAMTNEVLSTYEYFSRILNTCPRMILQHISPRRSYATFHSSGCEQFFR